MIELGHVQDMNIDEMVEMLLDYKAKGQHASCIFNGVTFDSETVTMDSAYMAITGETREGYYRKQAEYERYMKEARRRTLESEEERKARYQRLVEATRVPGEEVEIKIDTVVEGLKFIMENPGLSHEKLVLGLLMLDCNFTYEDYHRQFDGTQQSEYVEDGLEAGELSAGADVIINVRDSEFGRATFKERLRGLATRYIRKVTGDESYGNGDGQLTGGSAKK